ncbi:L-2-aminoadipate reductase [Neolecta irregularis DAH-3]|uniref:Alpha-aminoadipate reductase n=1 Tax=Neolecta irregularis (strain DAH-3) TaxID=1198029 RepID=A0A1U7LHC6_NEOID|nr:L-2-aminoadipate reductase [Neolecta irregularis DAH-3]|eukprot:OLL21931.1 L-2-aminoadipate reductase [Neolecta irregularis DAH-3]
MPSPLPADHPRPNPLRTSPAAQSFSLDQHTPSSLLLAALVALAHRLTGDDHVCIATNTQTAPHVVLRVPVTPALPFAALLALVANAYPSLLHLLTPQLLQNASESIALQRAHDPLPADLCLGFYTCSDTPSCPTDISIFAQNTHPTTLQVHYNQLLFSPDRITYLVQQLTQIVYQVALDRNQKVGSISLLTPAQKLLLPDPTVDLHWSLFQGPIQDIFASNAHKHPDRTCVVETPLTKDTPSRIFSYRHINEASNIVAHHLINKQIKTGDVVMVFAYRGVDLVIAVMGVLKAGATFSVIDPAYPPSRQCIYLKVAQPAGLIVLLKAGNIQDTVRQYITDELNIKAEILALYIQDDGKLIGQSDSFFSKEIKFASVHPGIVVGPDSIPTLSFTSGSEGIPKGVKGRHFSLTFYFPWMSQEFGLSQNDKFTMLSGIAHDPIQRDIFTPLFLGAQLIIPTADDIGTPGQLAKWMARSAATVTHLTPAMGQLLSAQCETQIPSLHHALFVGDILTKRDCLRLQSFARNCSVVNMYGSTETQRSVSFFLVPCLSSAPTFLNSLKDVIPAGKGMKDVQLLVINRNEPSQLCGIGELGEIYVRAGGLAEGYLQLPDVTKEKFVENWFVEKGFWKNEVFGKEWEDHWFGPRDRLYRTGDLGRYLPDGNVECSGRADDQVKIRGFRIELGEIDTFLSQHPFIRENITLVKRDKKNEQDILISYIVLELKSDLKGLVDGDINDLQGDGIILDLKKYEKLIKDVKEYLKNRLPSYAVPTVILPLHRFPLNPNGKIDKPSLPFPDSITLTSESSCTESNLTPTQQLIFNIWKNLLPHTRSISLQDDFFEIGGHSILATRLIFEIRKEFGINEISLHSIFLNPTIKSLSLQIDNLGNSEKSRNECQQDCILYAEDAQELVDGLDDSYAPVSITPKFQNVLVTGSTGFLGVFILRDLVERKSGIGKIFAHVRAKNALDGITRLRNSCLAYGVWHADWPLRIEVVTGDLTQERLGVDVDTWRQLAGAVDIVIHNGALVHWVYPYSKLRATNVLGTIEALSFCSFGKPKTFIFVSSTSVLDTEYYVRLSDTVVDQGFPGISEDDDLSGSKTGLSTGYAQSKWVGEYLVREAGARGLTGCIVRPGYITGDSKSGATNTDDFLMRLIKGCLQLGLAPDIHNSINMVPVNHVARIVTACSLNPPEYFGVAQVTGHPRMRFDQLFSILSSFGYDVEYFGVAQVTGHPRMRFDQLFSILSSFGYDVGHTDYIPWKEALERHVFQESKNNALYPLVHFLLNDLPQNTKAPELDDINTQTALRKDLQYTGEDLSHGAGVGEEDLGMYLAYLNAIGFLSAPTLASKLKLPSVSIDESILKSLEKVGGRGAKV